jgi:hypothetical protein
MIYERARLERLLIALDATARALWRDGCGDWAIKGKRGRIYADGSGFLIVVSTGDSIRLWADVSRGRPDQPRAQDQAQASPHARSVGDHHRQIEEKDLKGRSRAAHIR